MKRFVVLVLCLATLPASAGWRYRRPAVHPAPAAPQPPPPDPAAYARYVEALQRADAEARAAHDAAVRAILAAERSRRKEDPAIVDARVVAHLKDRIADGSLDARYDMAVRHIEGRGVPKDPAAAEKLLSEAAEKGHEPSQRLLKEWVASRADEGAETEASAAKAAP